MLSLFLNLLCLWFCFVSASDSVLSLFRALVCFCSLLSLPRALACQFLVYVYQGISVTSVSVSFLPLTFLLFISLFRSLSLSLTLSLSSF